MRSSGGLFGTIPPSLTPGGFGVLPPPCPPQALEVQQSSHLGVQQSSHLAGHLADALRRQQHFQSQVGLGTPGGLPKEWGAPLGTRWGCSLGQGAPHRTGACPTQGGFPPEFGGLPGVSPHGLGGPHNTGPPRRRKRRRSPPSPPRTRRRCGSSGGSCARSVLGEIGEFLGGLFPG